MTDWTTVIEPGPTGDRHHSEPFRVEVDAKPLAHLISQARQGHRVYELMLIDRLGDVWEYVLVRPLALPKSLQEIVERRRAEADPGTHRTHPWPADALPICEFDRGFNWVDDDPMPADLAWNRARFGPALMAFAARLLHQVRQSQWADDRENPLKHHEIGLIKAQRHSYDRLLRAKAIREGRRSPWTPPRHPPSFYARLEGLLADGNVASVSYRGRGDFTTVHQLCACQRRRATRTRRAPGKTLELNGLLDEQFAVENWGADFLFREQGLDLGDLHIEESYPNRSVAALLDRSLFKPRYVLAASEAGHLESYAAVSEDGWTLHTLGQPIGRRASLERLWRSRRLSLDLGVVLHFGEPGQLILEDDDAIVIVGESVDRTTRVALAAAMAEWEVHGGDPLIVVLGDAEPFALAGCRNVHPWPAGDPWVNEAYPESWLARLCAHKRRWLDLAVLIHPPAWTIEFLADSHPRSTPPWGPWIAGTADVTGVELDMTIADDVCEVFTEAYQRAQGMRR